MNDYISCFLICDSESFFIFKAGCKDFLIRTFIKCLQCATDCPRMLGIKERPSQDLRVKEGINKHRQKEYLIVK